jgi:hypothetical protein
MLVNLTPHAVNLLTETEEIVIPSAGIVRLREEQDREADLFGIYPVVRIRYAEAIGLPEEQEGTFYIVSNLVAQAFPGRGDLLVPVNMVRDEQGRILGCRALGRVG